MRALLPDTLDQALAMLTDASDHPVPIAGGTDLMVEWPIHQERHDATYIDLCGISELRSIHWTDDELVLGGTTTYWDLIRDEQAQQDFPILIEAARQVGAVQIQSRGTWAGNIANASPAADGVPVLMAHDATVVLRSASGERSVPLDRFYRGYKDMDRNPTELITAIRVPRRAHDIQVFRKVGTRRAQAITKIGLAILHSDDAGWRVVANSVAATVRRCPSVEALLQKKHPITGPAGFLEAIDADVAPIDDIRSSATYRRNVMARLLHSILQDHCPWIS